jgi:hypothetical protein
MTSGRIDPTQIPRVVQPNQETQVCWGQLCCAAGLSFLQEVQRLAACSSRWRPLSRLFAGGCYY